MSDNPAGANAVAAVESHEEPLFKGSVSLWMGFRTFMLVGLLEVAAIAILVYGGISAAPSLPRNTLLIAGAALLLSTNVMLFYVIARIRSNRYTITRKLIERESGLVVRHVDSLDLARVKDVELSQSLLERTLNIGTIELFSADRLNPDMRIEALPNPRPVYERLRDAVIALNQRRGIVTPEE
jgi:membrane protein YdbS with pleckstrin-like domain